MAKRKDLLLTESTVSRFMGLAGIGSLANPFLKEVNDYSMGGQEEEMEEGKDKDLNENTMFEKASGKENIDEVTVDELRDMIQDAIKAVMGGEAGQGEDEDSMDFDMGDEEEGEKEEVNGEKKQSTRN